MAPFGASSSLQDAPARSAHHPQTGRCWLRRQRSRLRPGVFARLLCATHSQPRGAAPLYLRSTERSAGVRAVHRRAHRRKADHGSLERRLALRDLDPHRNGQRFAPPQAPGSLSPPEWPGAALREIGRIERTLFMLDWLELPGLRRQATVELNKGEAPTPSPALSVSTASAGCAIVRSRRSNTVRAGLPSSPPLSRSGTPYISTVRSMTCVAAGK